IKGWGGASDYKTYTASFSFPGKQGFCGGYISPLILFFDGVRPQYLGNSAFPLYSKVKKIYWPEPGNNNAFFLATRNQQGKNFRKITSREQLFGQDEKFENGFEALKVHDKNKDGKIDSKDPIFKKLLLWNDYNGNGISDKGEIFTLKEKGITAISLDYTLDRYHFKNRAAYRERGKFFYNDKSGAKKSSDIIDVWFGEYK
ncbi:MAG: EF-hand domain-containing protein, partial [Oligoflexia bacterium]|nr:EF-hand domain-containing protein [Oligoflexia bacterium]